MPLILHRSDERVQAVAAINHGISLNEGQENGEPCPFIAQTGSCDPGIAGAGKSSAMKPVARSREEGKQVLGFRCRTRSSRCSSATPASVR